VRYVVGYSPDSGGRAALALARVFATSEAVQFTVCTITPATWGYPSPARVDAEYAEFLRSRAAEALEEAKQFLGEGVNAEYLARSARSAAEGLLDIIADLDASLVILGSGRGGPLGRLAVGSVTNSLLHSSPVPVALAPRGYHPSSSTRLTRVTCGYLDPERSAPTLAAACTLAVRHGVPLRLLTAIVRDRQMYPPLVGWRSEAIVEQQWREQARAAQQRALAELPAGLVATAELVEGEQWEDAFDATGWEEGEVLVIGSSRLGGGSRIFLGSNASKVVRSSPVPTVVVTGEVSANSAKG